MSSGVYTDEGFSRLKGNLLPLVLLLAAPTLSAKEKIEIPDVITVAKYGMGNHMRRRVQRQRLT
jgi:hypothetical protein